jgi:hypothetical protein
VLAAIGLADHPAGADVRRRSLKRGRQEAEYRRMHPVFMDAHPLCAVCGKASEQIHHQAGRVGNLLTDDRYWVAVCALCHEQITTQPTWAYARGLSLHRTWDSECPTPTPGDAA